MPKEIKFRIWNGVKMVFGPTDDNPNSSWVLAFSETVNFPLQQFTGLKDKNGKEIYVGDLVKYQYSYNMNSDLTPNIQTGEGEISMTYFCFGINSDNKFGLTWIPMEYFINESNAFKNQSIEIVGNIFENPELLLKKDNSQYSFNKE